MLPRHVELPQHAISPDPDALPPHVAQGAGNTNLEVSTMIKRGTLDTFEGTVRFVLGVVLVLIAWDYGWTVIGTGAFVLGIISLATAIVGMSPGDRLLARITK
jgi:hypothetical protein